MRHWVKSCKEASFNCERMTNTIIFFFRYPAVPMQDDFALVKYHLTEYSSWNFVNKPISDAMPFSWSVSRSGGWVLPQRGLHSRMCTRWGRLHGNGPLRTHAYWPMCQDRLWLRRLLCQRPWPDPETLLGSARLYHPRTWPHVWRTEAVQRRSQELLRG